MIFLKFKIFGLKSLLISKKYLKFVRGMFNTLGETNFNSFSDKKDDYFIGTLNSYGIKLFLLRRGI